MSKQKSIVLVIAGIALVMLALLWANINRILSPIRPSLPAVSAGLPFTLEIADTEAARAQGLGDRDAMPLDHAMLFVFDKPGVYPFWMRHMHFPLDIVFIRDRTVVDVASSMQPPSSDADSPATYTPKQAADRVLELNAGQAKAYGLQVGSTIPALP